MNAYKGIWVWLKRKWVILIKMKTPLFEYKVKYTETTFKSWTLTSLMWVKKDKETGENYMEII